MFSLMIQRPKSPLACEIQPRMSIVESSFSGATSPVSTGPAPKLKFANGKPLPEIIRFDVQLDRPRQTFFSGDVISGEVRIQLAEYLTVKGIIVRFVGEAYVNVPPEDEIVPAWDIRRITRLRHAFRKNRVRPTAGNKSGNVTTGGDKGGNDANLAKASFTSPQREHAPETNGCAASKGTMPDNLSKIHASKKKPRGKQPNPNSAFRSSEKYFDHKIYVFGHKYSSVKESLWPGCHAFPFQYTLPTKLPTSFHGRFGYVRYFCEASLERAWQPSVRRRAFFSVSAAVDVNLDPKAESSAGGQRTSNQCFFCCQAGTVVVEANIRRRGYVPGESILVSADITNMSNYAVSSTSARLFQVVTYHSSKGFRHREDLVLVADANQGRVPCGESASWDSVPVVVPPLPASFHVTECCKVLDVDYRLDFVVEMEGGAVEPLIISMAIVIGTVPLQRSFRTLLPPDPLLTGSPLSRMTSLKYKGFPAVFSMPCIWGPRPLEHYFHREIPRKNEDCVRVLVPGETFAPRYVCYRNRESEAPPSDLAEPLTVEPPPPRRSRASSLQPTAAPRPHSSTRNAHSSTQLALQPQPLHEPIHRTLAQLKSQHLVSPTRSLQSTPTHKLLLSPTRLSSIPDHEGFSPRARRKSEHKSPTSPLLRELLDSPTWRRPLTSSTSDQIWTIPRDNLSEQRVPTTAPPNINLHN